MNGIYTAGSEAEQRAFIEEALRVARTGTITNTQLLVPNPVAQQVASSALFAVVHPSPHFPAPGCPVTRAMHVEHSASDCAHIQAAVSQQNSGLNYQGLRDVLAGDTRRGLSKRRIGRTIHR